MGLRFRYSASPQCPQTCSASLMRRLGAFLPHGSVLLQNYSVLSLYQHWSSSALQENGGRYLPLCDQHPERQQTLRMSEIVNLDIYPSKWRKDKNQHHVTSQHCEHHASLLIVQKKDLEKKHRLCLVNLLNVLRASMIFFNKTLCELRGWGNLQLDDLAKLVYVGIV